MSVEFSCSFYNTIWFHIGLFSVQNCAMAPLDSADGALRSMCRVVAKLLHPEQNSEESDLHHLQMCEKILHEQPEQKPIATKLPDDDAKVNCEMHASALRTGPSPTACDLGTSIHPRQLQGKTSGFWVFDTWLKVKAQSPQSKPGLSAWAKDEATQHFSIPKCMGYVRYVQKNQKDQGNLKHLTVGPRLTGCSHQAVRYFRENLALDDKWSTGWYRS